MRFTPKTDEEIKKAQSDHLLWPKGHYDFEVVEATDEVSSAGNEMIKLRLSVFNESGGKRTIWDYLLPAMEYKLAHACEAMNLSAQYETGELRASDFDGKVGQLILYIKKGSNGYADQNAVADYVKPAQQTRVPGPRPASHTPSRVKAPASDIDDEIPFGPCWQ